MVLENCNFETFWLNIYLFSIHISEDAVNFGDNLSTNTVSSKIKIIKLLFLALKIIKVVNVNLSGRSMVNLRLVSDWLILCLKSTENLNRKNYHGLPKIPVFHVLSF